MTRCPDCDALRLSLARTEGQLASADRSWIEMRDESDRAIDARDAAVQAYKDSAEVLAQVAAERDALAARAEKAEAAQEKALDWVDGRLGVSIKEHDGLRADIAARDRALDACAERIADLLGQYWPATLGRNLAMGGALSMARWGGIRFADGYGDWYPGRGKPHPSINDEPEEG